MTRKPTDTPQKRGATTELDILHIIHATALGIPTYHIAAELKMNDKTVQKYQRLRLKDIDEAKKEIEKKMKKDMKKELKKLSFDIFDLIKRTYNTIDQQKLNNSSAAQLTTMFGILVDKYNILMGNPTENIDVTFKNKQEMLNYLKNDDTEGNSGEPLKNNEENSNLYEVMSGKRRNN